MGARGSSMAWTLAVAAIVALLAVSAAAGSDLSANQTPSNSTPKATITARPYTCGKSTKIPASKLGTCGRDAQVALNRHNAARARYGAAPLLWSSTLARFANKVTRTCEFEHSGGPYGENLAAADPRYGLTCSNSVDLWMSEAEKWPPPGGPRFTGDTGHFTQVVWKDTWEVGCAITRCRDFDIVACEYNPPGNYEGEFRAQVGKKGERPPCYARP